MPVSVAALSPNCQSNDRLSGNSSCTIGAPASRAFEASTTTGKFFIIHFDQICGITGLLLGLCDDNRNTISYMTNFVWASSGCFGSRITSPSVKLTCQPVGNSVDVSNICPCKNSYHSVCGFSRCSINALDLCVRQWLRKM